VKVLRTPVRAVAPGIYAGTVGQHEVHATSGPRGWRVYQIDTRRDEFIAFGFGATLELAEQEADRSVAVFAARRAAQKSAA
jgi:hypothetical protein